MKPDSQTYSAFDPFGIFRFWASFLPTAPLMGVDYRFADQAPDWFAFMTAFGPQPLDAEGEEETAAADVEAPALMATEPAEPDDLTRIKGVGPKVQVRLNELGIHTFAQLADFDAKDLAWLDQNVGGIKGACIRGDWAGQARAMLAS